MRPPAASFTDSNRPGSSATFALTFRLLPPLTFQLLPVHRHAWRVGGQPPHGLPTVALLRADVSSASEGGGWQDRRESNPQPPVLETGALPIELLSSITGSGLTA